MATIDVYDVNNNRTKALQLSDTVFKAEIKSHLVHAAIRVQLTNQRAGTVAVKNRSAVAGSGKKPFKQKGTGQARQGCCRAPQYPGGGVAFGPKQKDYSLSMNKKAHKAAMRSVLTHLIEDNKLIVVEDLSMEKISTKNFISTLNRWNLDKALVVIEGINPVLELSARNVKNVKLIHADFVNVYDLVAFKNIIITEAAISKLDGALQS
jgi:large subunit ribosomal protein L4